MCLRHGPRTARGDANPPRTGRRPGRATLSGGSSVTPGTAAATAAAAAVFARARFVDLDRAAADFLAVERADGVVGAVFHLHETEAARLPRLAVGDQAD